MLTSLSVPRVCMDPSVHFPSTWKSDRGKPLTDRAILQYAREGRYGPRWKELADKRVSLDRLGNPILCVQCKSPHDVRLRRWDYFPKPGYYCLKCCKHFRAERDRRVEDERRWREALNTQYDS